MSILSRTLISPSMRFDLEEYNGLLSDLRTDSKLFSKSFLSQVNQIVSGFIVTGLSQNQATVLMVDSSLLLTEGTADFSYFVSPPIPTDIIVTDAQLTDGARNFLEISLATQDGTPLSRAFWDQNANSGLGSEFSQIVNTVTDLRVVITTSTTGFSVSTDFMPLAILDVNGSGQITTILDRRNLFGRLSLPSNLNNEHAWGTKVEPPYSLTMTGVVGVFVAGETINIGTETATVVVGGTTPITFSDPTGINFFPGDAVSGVTSGATGTIATVSESFVGVDKDLQSIGEILKAVQTEIKLIKGTDRWWKDAGSSLASTGAFLNSLLVQASLNSVFQWNGSALSITDAAAIPGNSDVVAFLRQLGKSTDMSFTRQSTGQEIQTITFTNVPDAGVLTLDHNGDLSLAINPGDDAAAVQTAVNATWASTVVVSGSFASGFAFTFNVAGDTVGIFVNNNTLTSSATPITITVLETQRGYSGGSTIPIGLDQVLFVDVPEIGSRTFSDVGVGVTNYQVVNRSAFVSTQTNYWIAFNQGGLLYLRGMGELEPGEETPISDPDKETILALLESQNTRANEDRGIELTDGGVWNVVGNVLSNSATANILIPGSPFDINQIAAQSLTFPNVNSTAFVTLDRGAIVQSFRSPSVVDIEDVPVSNDVFIFARRTALGILVG